MFYFLTSSPAFYPSSKYNKVKNRKIELSNVIMYFSHFRGIAEFEIFLYVFLVTAFVKFICIYFNCLSSINDIASVPTDALKAITDLWILITCMLLRPTNVILPSCLIISSNVVCKVLRKRPNEITKLILIHHWLARVYFFYQVREFFHLEFYPCSRFCTNLCFKLSNRGIPIV